MRCSSALLAKSALPSVRYLLKVCTNLRISCLSELADNSVEATSETLKNEKLFPRKISVIASQGRWLAKVQRRSYMQGRFAAGRFRFACRLHAILSAVVVFAF